MTLTLVAGIWVQPRFEAADRKLPWNLTQPLIAAELARGPESAAWLTGDEMRAARDRDAMATHLGRDGVFIASYTALFVGCSILVARRRDWRWAVLPMLLTVAAAALDFGENAALRGVLTTMPAAYPYRWSTWKWAAIFVALASLWPALVERNGAALRRSMGWIAAGISWLLAGLGLLGIVFWVPALIEASTKWMVVLLGVAWVYFVTYPILEEGLLPVLNRVAAWPGIRWIASLPYRPPR